MEIRPMSIFLAGLIFSSVFGTMGYFYWDLNSKHNKLQSSYNSLLYNYSSLNETHHTLFINYTELNQVHKILIFKYNELNASYNVLELNYTALKEDYQDLNNKYLSLFNDYNTLSQAFNKPLSYEKIPDTYELKQWLATDQTDEILYNDPNFKCGDFAVMLSQHAKLEYWDMGIVAVFGYTETYTSYAHAFNAIITVDGLVYVEPQNDHVWWYTDHKEIYEDTWFEIDDEWIYVQEYVVIVSFD